MGTILVQYALSIKAILKVHKVLTVHQGYILYICKFLYLVSIQSGTSYVSANYLWFITVELVNDVNVHEHHKLCCD